MDVEGEVKTTATLALEEGEEPRTHQELLQDIEESIGIAATPMA